MLNGKRDAYGKLLKDFFDGNHVSEIIERNDGLINLGGGPRVYFSTFDSWNHHVQEAISLAKGRVLDIGCGAGRFALHLQEKMLEVVGIDNSELAINVSKARGLKNAFPVSIDEIDSGLGKFDTILLLGNGFGLLQSFDKGKQILAKLKETTSEDALIIAESINPYGSAFNNDLRYFEKNKKKGRMSGQFRIRIRHLDYKTPYFDFLFVSPDEMRDILYETGWELISTIGDVNNGYIAIIKRG